MEKRSYIAEGTRQLINTIHFAKLDAPIYLNTAKLVSCILNRLNSSGGITEKQLHFLLPPAEPRPRYSIVYTAKHSQRGKLLDNILQNATRKISIVGLQR